MRPCTHTVLRPTGVKITRIGVGIPWAVRSSIRHLHPEAQPLMRGVWWTRLRMESSIVAADIFRIDHRPINSINGTKVHAINIPVSNKPALSLLGRLWWHTTGSRSEKAELQVVMIDRNNYHTFQPFSIRSRQADWNPIHRIPFAQDLKQQNFIFRMRKLSRLVRTKFDRDLNR